MEQPLTILTTGYHERMHRLGLFEPLYRLKNKTGKDGQGAPIDYYGLGLLTLLFFFEHMLMRKKVGVRDLAKYLAGLTAGVVFLDAAGFENLARAIIEVFRPPLGKKYSHTFYNWDSGQDQEIIYHYLKAAKHDLDANSQYYVLDEHGLELVFATKEFFSEFQLSINQLLLRKQLEKGEFVNALRQIDEMRMNVEQLQQRIHKVKQEIQRNIISDQSYRHYEETIQDVYLRLQYENEEFEELITFVRDTKERLSYVKNDQRDQRAYGLIIKIDLELGEVHRLHRLLLKEAIKLNTTVLRSAREALYFVAVRSFNFDQEIAARLVSVPLPVSAARVLAQPFLTLEQYQGWCPWSVFDSQPLGRVKPPPQKQDFLIPTDEEQKQEEQKIQRQNFTRIMQLVYDLFGAPASFTLRQLVEKLPEHEHASILDHRSFYDFWLLLHQNSPLLLDGIDQDEQGFSFARAPAIFGNQVSQIVCRELPGVVQVNRRYSIQNFSLELRQ